jgi:hypothetical protein
MKTIIKDQNTNEFYCIEQTEMINGELTAGPNDFPYWSSDINEAYDFISVIAAQSEMQFNDLAQDGARIPAIETIES